jgi:hypothetical protein
MAKRNHPVGELGTLTPWQQLALSLSLVRLLTLECLHLPLLFGLFFELLLRLLNLIFIILEQILRVLHQIHIFFFFNDEGELIYKVSEVLLHDNVECALIRQSRELSILLPEEAEVCRLALQDVMHTYQQALLLYALHCKKNVVAIRYLHALRMDDILVIRIFLVQTELDLFETCEVIKRKHQSVGFGGLLDL